MRTYLSPLKMAIVAALPLGCSEPNAAPTNPFAPSVTASFPRSSHALIQGARDRKDTPTQRMTDAQFSMAVERAGGRVLIGLKDPEKAEGVDNFGRVVISTKGYVDAIGELRRLGVIPEREFRRTPTVVATIAPALAAVLRHHSRVDYIEASSLGAWHTQVTPWGVTKIGAPQAWSLSTGSGIKLLLIDSGVDSTAQDLSFPVAWRCISGAVWDNGTHIGHGTIVAGAIGALNNSIDVVGAAYGVALWSANITVNGAPDKLEAACSVDAARSNGVSVVNMSFAVDTSVALTDAINGGYNEDNMVFVASVGQDNGGSVRYPGSLSNVIAVTATDSLNVRYSTANIGPEIDLAAPGVNVLSTSLPGASTCTSVGYTTICSGTSLAAPHVSAAAALLMARYPTWSNATVRSRLLNTATDLGSAGFDNYFGNGLLNVAKAIGMQIEINGPDFVYTGHQETWSVSASGGQTPRSYEWFVAGNSEGTSSSLTYTVGGLSFWLKVHVTDYYNLLVKDSIYVVVSSCTPPEISC